MNIESRFQKPLRKLYKEFEEASDIFKRGFASIESIHVGSILFIGLNPSYTLEEEPEKPEEIFYHLNQRGNYSYFKKFADISDQTGIMWSHLDLLTVRETSQSKVLELLKVERVKEFIWKHLLITKQILEMIDPNVIVVANTAARMFMGKDVDKKGNNRWLGYKFEFDPEIGTHRIKNVHSELYNKPVFFTSMLTGQRALDNGSFERLKWHIDWILKKGT